MKVLSIPTAMIILALSIVGAYSLLAPPVCYSEVGRSPEDGPDFLAYRARAYAVMGPIQLVSFSSSKLVVYASPSKIPVSLKRKDVSILDWYSQPIKSSKLEKGKRVYVVRKGKEVLIFLAKDQEPLPEETKDDDSKSGGADDEK